MTKEEFIAIVTDNIMPLFTGSKILGETESSPRDFEVALGPGGVILLKAGKQENYRLILKKIQPFKGRDILLVKAMLSELLGISLLDLQDPTYVRSLQTMAIEKAICESLSEAASATLLGILAEVYRWSNRTYEGKNLSLGIIVDEVALSPFKSPGLHYSKFCGRDFFALLTNGKNSYIEVDRDGYLLGHTSLEKVRSAPTICPNDFINISRYCGDKRVGICLLESGDVLLFKDHMLQFAKKRGNWNVYSHGEIIQLLSVRASTAMKEVRKSIYYTALDCSFEGTGGCIVYVNKDKSEQALMHIDARDVLAENYFQIKKKYELEEADKLYNLTNREALYNTYDKTYEEFLLDEKCVKTTALRCIIKGKKFHELNRFFREEIVAMDGATVIDYDGTIIASGAILKIDAGSEGGGRLAATKTLAKYGVAIKISVDGTIQGFYYDKKNGKDKILFTVG